MPRCAACGHDYRWIDAPDLCCPSCHHDPTAGDAVARRTDGQLADLDERLDRRLRGLGKGLENRLGDLDACLTDLNRRLDSTDGPRRGTGDRKHGLQGSAARARDGAEEMQIPPGFLLDEAEVGELRDLVFRSRHVRENGAYEDAASGTRFAYLEQETEFNAFAMRDAVGPRVVILGGLVREFGAMAIMATFGGTQAGQGLRTYVQQRLAAAPGAAPGALPLAARPSAEDLARLHYARELLCAMVMYVIGHELGHVCYGHIYGPGYSGQPLEVYQNQERDADSFASSVIAGSPNKEHWFAGQVYALLTMAVFEAHGVVAEFATHPTARERLRNAVRSNPDAAAAMGITEELVDQIAPAPGSMAEG